MRAVVFAYHNMGLSGLEALWRHGFDIAAIFTHEDKPDENCWFGSVWDWAKQRGILPDAPENIKSHEIIEKIAFYQPDFIFSFYYRKMICREILELARLGAFNLHGSLLPAYRGRCPVNWVLVKGEEKTGVTLHFMVEKPDAGDIVGQKEVAIALEDTARTLNDKLCQAAAALLDDLLPRLKTGNIPRQKQNLAMGSYYGGRRPEDGRIFWRQTAEEIYNLTRAVTDPYPGAFAFMENWEKILIWRARPVAIDFPGKPGETSLSGGQVLVKTGKMTLKLLEIEINGHRMQETQLIDYFKQREVKRLT